MIHKSCNIDNMAEITWLLIKTGLFTSLWTIDAWATTVGLTGTAWPSAGPESCLPLLGVDNSKPNGQVHGKRNISTHCGAV